MEIDWQPVVDWFGCMPTFHDAEVISIELRRRPEPSAMRVLTWLTSENIDEKGHLVHEREAVVRFTFFDITGQELNNWNHQNVLLSLESTVDRGDVVVILNASYGLSGYVRAKSILVDIENNIK